ncbi:MAG TPA: WcaI family glycosyltransferase [Novosphingobium sp.]|nr:WcaI family glycosyltransferase [Novosphingobium sp.]
MAKPKLSILITTPFHAPELTGVGRYSGELARGLAQRGNSVEVVAPPPYYPGWHVRAPYSAKRYQTEKLEGTTVRRCPIFIRPNASGLVRLLSPVSFAITSAPVVFWRVVTGRPDVVLVVEPTLASVPVAWAAARLVGARTVLHVQDLELDAALVVGHMKLPKLAEKAAFAFERLLMRGFDRIVTISNKMADAIGRKRVPADRIALIRNWVDVDSIKPLASANPYRAELGIADDRFVCLYSGQIGRKQALHLMLEAAERLAADSRFVFVVAGEGPEKEPLQARYGGLSNVRFLGLQPEERLNAFLNLADCHILPQDAGVSDLVLPSKLGGMLASGRRILVTADDDSELAMFLEGTASIVPPGDPDAIARELKLLIDAPDEKSEQRLDLARSISSQICLDRFDELLGR